MYQLLDTHYKQIKYITEDEAFLISKKYFDGKNKCKCGVSFKSLCKNPIYFITSNTWYTIDEIYDKYKYIELLKSTDIFINIKIISNERLERYLLLNKLSFYEIDKLKNKVLYDHIKTSILNLYYDNLYEDLRLKNLKLKTYS